MQAEMLHAKRLQLFEALCKLLPCKAVLGVRRVAHYGRAYAELAARIEAAGYGIRYAAMLLKKIYKRYVVKVNGGV